MGYTPSHREHITGTYTTRELLDHARECNDNIIMESKTKKANILTKKHTARPDSQNCSGVSPVTSECGGEKKQRLWSLEDYGASERQRKTTEEATAARTHALTHAHAHKHQPPARSRAHDTRHRQERRCYPSPPHKARAADANHRRRTQGRGRSAAPGLARANHLGPHHTPTLPTRLPHISDGETEFEE